MCGICVRICPHNCPIPVISRNVALCITSCHCKLSVKLGRNHSTQRHLPRCAAVKLKSTGWCLSHSRLFYMYSGRAAGAPALATSSACTCHVCLCLPEMLTYVIWEFQFCQGLLFRMCRKCLKMTVHINVIVVDTLVHFCYALVPWDIYTSGLSGRWLLFGLDSVLHLRYVTWQILYPYGGTIKIIMRIEMQIKILQHHHGPDPNSQDLNNVKVMHFTFLEFGYSFGCWGILPRI